MTTKEILEKYIKFFEDKGHKKIPNVSLVPENDPSLLFVNSGMFPLVPYLSGEPHPLGKRLVNVQRALRLQDIDDIGDSSHTLVFHMLGNWSLGDYFKKEQLPWIYEFLIKELGLDIKRIAASVFEGDADAKKDEESIELLKEIFEKYGVKGVENKNIFAYGKSENWWQRGDAIGELGGPDSEIFYYMGDGDFVALGKNPVDNENEFFEIGNSVFMQYKKTKKGWEELRQKNVDFGGGLERMVWMVQDKKDIFETDGFYPIIKKIEEVSGKKYGDSDEITKSMRIVADHMRACVFLAMDGVEPDNKDQGYVLRRLLRRMIRAGKTLGVEKNLSVNLVSRVVDTFDWLYPTLRNKMVLIEQSFRDEEERFLKTLHDGAKQIDKVLEKEKSNDAPTWSGIAFDLYQSLGYPSEIFVQDLKERKVPFDEIAFIQQFDKLVEKHQEQSRGGAEGKFKGGLADHSDTVVKYHTVTHLLQAGLQGVLGNHVGQAGSNITNERARFDFEHPQKLTDEEITKVAAFVNDKISDHIPVNFEMMSKEDAIDAGAGYMKHETYPDKVKVYYIGNSLKDAISKEFCGGPHVENTGDLTPIQIYKQENIGKGKRRIYLKFI